jgi:hypothetical protein
VEGRVTTLNVGFRTESFGPFSYLFERIAHETYGLDLQDRLAESK